MREVAVALGKWNGYSGGRLLFVNNTNNGLNGNNNLNNNGRFVGIVRLWLGHPFLNALPEFPPRYIFSFIFLRQNAYINMAVKEAKKLYLCKA